MSKKYSIYLAGGWFTPRTRDILDHLEINLDSREDVDLYSPRRDGVMLPPNQKHDTELRESIFKENIENILKSDLVFANIDSVDPYNDPGTMYEIGYAMANNIPVVGFTLSKDNISSRFKGIIDGFDCILEGYEYIDSLFDSYATENLDKSDTIGDKVLFVGSGNGIVDSKIASHIMDNGFNLRWVNEEHDDIYSRIDEIFKDVKCMIAVVDDRKTLVSWMIGQAYEKGVPIITYSDYGYGINVMLLVSILTHIRGTDELQRILQQMKRKGIESIPKMDISELESM